MCKEELKSDKQHMMLTGHQRCGYGSNEKKRLPSEVKNLLEQKETYRTIPSDPSIKEKAGHIALL